MRSNLKAGISLLVAGLLVAILIHAYPENLRAPIWVAYAAAAPFGLAGLSLVGSALGFGRAAAWCVCLLLAAMAAIPAWIALGSGSRQCMLTSVGAHSAASESICRGTFGLASVVAGVMLVVAVRSALRRGQAG